MPTIDDFSCAICLETLHKPWGFGNEHVSDAELTTKVVAQPTSDQIPFDVNTNLIVEFYR